MVWIIVYVSNFWVKMVELCGVYLRLIMLMFLVILVLVLLMFLLFGLSKVMVVIFYFLLIYKEILWG